MTFKRVDVYSITNCGTFKGSAVARQSRALSMAALTADGIRTQQPQAGKCWHPRGISLLRGDLLGHSLLGTFSGVDVWVLTLSGHGACKHERGLVSEGHIVRVALGVPGQMPR